MEGMRLSEGILIAMLYAGYELKKRSWHIYISTENKVVVYNADDGSQSRYYERYVDGARYFLERTDK